MTAAAYGSTGKTTNAKYDTANGCKISLQNDNHAAVSIRSADFEARDAPIANRAPGVAADPNMDMNSFNGAGIGISHAAQTRPIMIDTIIGFFTKPSARVHKIPICIRPSRLPTMTITTIDPKTNRSTASTIITWPTAPSPIKSASIGIPKKPTLPITAHWASIAASANGFLRHNDTQVASKYIETVAPRYANTKSHFSKSDSDKFDENRNNIAESAK